MSGSPFAAPACSVEVYPFEGGPLTIEGGQIISVTVTKSLRGEAAGTFSLNLAPGGPDGPESQHTWSETLTPMSHVLIGMSRGADAALVMDGVLVAPAESQAWTTTAETSTAQRGQSFQGYDFSWFFSSFNYYALTFYGLAVGTDIGSNLGYLPGSLYNLLNQGELGGSSAATSSPVKVGQGWYHKVMAGANGVLGQTFVPYQNESRVTFNDAMRTVWEDYPSVFIPTGDYFMVDKGSWTAKFIDIFPFPWYEFFVTTAPKDAYTPSSAASGGDAGTQFTMSSITVPDAGPVLVARINPVPRFIATTSGSTVSAGDMDLSRWNALPVYDLTQQPYNFFQSSIAFSAEEARNFYQVNPTNFSTLYGLNSANNIPSIFLFDGAADPASVHRYGFRPLIASTRWFWDPQGNAAQSTANDFKDTLHQLLAHVISWFHPTPLMAQAQVVLPLSPSIMIGTRFRYPPFKNGEPWDFYVETVTHRFVFGGQSVTQLSLSRGLPQNVYEDSAGVLKDIHIGNAMRQNAVYTSGLPSGSTQSLTFIQTQQQAEEIAGPLAQVFVTPQSNSTTTSPSGADHRS